MTFQKERLWECGTYIFALSCDPAPVFRYPLPGTTIRGRSRETRTRQNLKKAFATHHRTPPLYCLLGVLPWWNTAKLPYALWNMPKKFRLCNISCKNTTFCAIKYLFCCVQPYFAAFFARSSFPPKRTTTSCGPVFFSSASDHRTPSPTSCLRANIARLVN